MITYGLLLALALFMRFGPDIPFRRMLNGHLVERPVALLLVHKRYRYLTVIIAASMLLLGGELVLLFGPELILAYAADVALYIDLVVVAAASTSWTRTRRMLARWTPRFGRNLADKRKGSAATPRAKRTQRAPAALSKANDDDNDRPYAAFIAAPRSYAAAA
ncbi:hypothetical protein [Citromicrobium sp. WPS32]|uniref:hypothetical protein n=1 Tax=Citromicrobium sp. WPS32 TaxID=1634517 RepID=UPI0006C911CB|nr:hypothetical protein [Citromicrobium sp. WPS32]KPM15978.1 hypothetical protein WG75_08085 [Citromicrobium sp. WPS32]|tara:strand:- start:4829 stop:5314 length:486 start_codon:yes stop_codon:yes gene_type:complete